MIDPNARKLKQGSSELFEIGIVYGQKQLIKRFGQQYYVFLIWIGQNKKDGVSLQKERWFYPINSQEEKAQVISTLVDGYNIVVRGHREAIVQQNEEGYYKVNTLINVADDIVILSTQKTSFEQFVKEVQVVDSIYNEEVGELL